MRGFGGLRVRGCATAAAAVVVRDATVADVAAIESLIAAHVADGHLLPRAAAEIAAHASRFVVASAGERVIGCADIAPLSAAVAEVRSLVIGEEARGLGVGVRLLTELVERSTTAGFRTLCAFTTAPGFFIQMGFSIVPHSWLPEKIQTDCRSCARFRACGQYAVMLPLGPTCRR